MWIYDAGFYDRNDLSLETGDYDGLGNSTSGGANMTYALYRPDGTPHDPTDNVFYCARVIFPKTNSTTFRNQWRRVCAIGLNPIPEGMWVLKVTSGGDIGGTNQYSTAGQQAAASTRNPPKIYAINDMGIFTNEASGNATVWLAEVLPVHAGKQLELRFFDPGESAPPATMTVQTPSGATATELRLDSRQRNQRQLVRHHDGQRKRFIVQRTLDHPAHRLFPRTTRATRLPTATPGATGR